MLKLLNKNFSMSTLKEFSNAMEDCFDHDQIKILSLLYFLNYVCASEAKSDNDVWVKVFLLNASDIRKGIWDLDVHWDTYLANMTDALDPYLDEIKEYITKRKVKINFQILNQYDKILNYVPEEKKEEESETVEEPEVKEESVETVEAEEVSVTPIANGEIVDAEVIE